MTIKETEEAIKVMQAWVDGKAVQCTFTRDNTEWEDFTPNDCPLWDWHTYTYRIKPEPVEIEMWVHPEYPPFYDPSGSIASPKDFANQGWTKKKFREVIE